ncbi:uncharacterized protein LOC132280922 [Cornus florida]|uniref:uncharacterized protein LOC132280922 n=1 Tax=Cornus florida TaxID=4283 RepID=UPI0028A034FF|nr:uncharacterized protein LOC132280922 [Cornus florida]
MKSTLVSSAPRACYGCGQQGYLIRDCPNQGAGTGSGRESQQRQSQSATAQSGWQFTGTGATGACLCTCTDCCIFWSISSLRVVRDCSNVIVVRTFVFDLILLEMTSFDVILGMDWLASFHATIDCFRGRVTVCTPEEGCFFFVGDRSDSHTLSFYGIRKRSRGDYFLASLLAEHDDVVEKDYPAVVRDFLDVFPEDLTELPPH